MDISIRLTILVASVSPRGKGSCGGTHQCDLVLEAKLRRAKNPAILRLVVQVLTDSIPGMVEGNFDREKARKVEFAVIRCRWQ